MQTLYIRGKDPPVCRVALVIFERRLLQNTMISIHQTFIAEVLAVPLEANSLLSSKAIQIILGYLQELGFKEFCAYTLFRSNVWTTD